MVHRQSSSRYRMHKALWLLNYYFTEKITKALKLKVTCSDKLDCSEPIAIKKNCLRCNYANEDSLLFFHLCD